ncbi:hypothetical protein VPHK469_0061 [Vibrio phage K469]
MLRQVIRALRSLTQPTQVNRLLVLLQCSLTVSPPPVLVIQLVVVTWLLKAHLTL